MDLPGPLDKQLGPFAVWQWLIIGGAGVGAAVLIRRSHLFGGEGKTPVDEATDQPVDPAANGDIYGPGIGYATGGGVAADASGMAPIPVQTNPSPATAITTNDQWVNAAVRAVIASGGNALAVQNALAKYLQGYDLSSTEAQLVDNAIRAVGPPPEGAPAVVITPATPNLPPVTLPVTTTPPPITLPPSVTPTPSPAPNGPAYTPGSQTPYTRPLKITNPPMRGADVLEWQTRVGTRGYGVGPADGIYGPKSEAVARQIQQNYGLAVDGIVGPATWAATFDGFTSYGRTNK